MEKLIEMRDLLRKAADQIDDILAIDAREKNGEDVAEESELAQTRFIMTLMKFQQLTK